MSLERYGKRKSNVELIRIMACLIVIAVHIKYGLTDAQNNADYSKIFVSCFVADGVALFLMISGFFFDRKINYKKSLVSTFKKIIIPELIYVVVVMIYQIIYSEKGILDFLKTLCKDVLLLKNDAEYMYHLWYIYIYVIIILIFPLLQALIKYFDENNLWRIFIPTSIILLVWNDILRNSVFQFSHHMLNALIPACVILFFGYYIYENRDIICKNKIIVAASIIIFIVLNILRSFCELYTLKKTGSDNLLFWYSSFGVICASCLVIFMLGIFRKPFVSKFINFVGSLTFPIYLFHVIVFTFFYRIGIPQRIESFLVSAFGHTIVQEILYTAIYALIVFISTFIITAVFRTIKNLIKDLYLKIK